MAANVLNLTPPAPISHVWSNPVRPNQMPLAISPDRNAGTDIMSSSIRIAWPRSTASSLETPDKPEGILKVRLQHPYRSHRPLPGPSWRAAAKP